MSRTFLRKTSVAEKPMMRQMKMKAAREERVKKKAEGRRGMQSTAAGS